MPQRTLFNASIRFIRSFGGQVAMSVAASAVGAAFLAAPGMLAASDIVTKGAASQSGLSAWVSPIAPDGKIGERHREAESDQAVIERSGQGLLTPAMIAMPMSTSWPSPAFAEHQLAQVPPSAVTRPRIAEVHAPAATPVAARKLIVAAERPKQPAVATRQPATPMLVLIQDHSEDVVDPPQLAALRQSSPSTIARVGDVMTSAVGTVGAVGIWTLSRASSLLPRL